MISETLYRGGIAGPVRCDNIVRQLPVHLQTGRRRWRIVGCIWRCSAEYFGNLEYPVLLSEIGGSIAVFVPERCVCSIRKEEVDELQRARFVLRIHPHGRGPTVA